MEKIQEELRRSVVVVMVMVQIMLACDGEAQWRVPALVADPTQRRQLCASVSPHKHRPACLKILATCKKMLGVHLAQKILLFLISHGAFFAAFTCILQPEETQAVTSY